MERVRIREKETGKIFEVAPVVAREWVSSGLGEAVSVSAPEDAKEPAKAPSVQKVPEPAKARKPIEKKSQED